MRTKTGIKSKKRNVEREKRNTIYKSAMRRFKFEKARVVFGGLACASSLKEDRFSTHLSRGSSASNFPVHVINISLSGHSTCSTHVLHYYVNRYHVDKCSSNLLLPVSFLFQTFRVNRKTDVNTRKRNESCISL